MIPSPPAAPTMDVAPTCWVRLPTCTETMTPNGIATRIAGNVVTVMTNQVWVTVQEDVRR